MNRPIDARSGNGPISKPVLGRGCDMHKFLVLASVCLVGCSGEPQEPVYSVHGQVLWEGQPLADALVVLHRLDRQGCNLTAHTDSAGRFEMTTYQPGDGDPLGLYAATVEYRELVQEGDERMRNRSQPAASRTMPTQRLRDCVAKFRPVLMDFLPGCWNANDIPLASRRRGCGNPIR